ncbi:MAG: TIGR03960 family B12-binding radical SAM protein [Chitinispirillaceae bacterium]|nr:TIGR03960 family B12-binding radical SAM protein [Chitinispirillaceae bacterium]
MNDLRAVLDRDVLPFVEKPLRYTGNELNCVRKDLSRVALHGVFCFPDLYDIGMSHLGLQIIYSIVNGKPSWALSRCFHPWTDMEAKMRELHIPLYSLEYLTPVREADWIGFTVQYELHATNILNMLDLAGIPLTSRERGSTDPLVIAGGPCMGNPEPFADFFDAVAIGDGEETAVELCRVMEEKKRAKAGREDTLRALADVRGVYVPSLYEVKKSSLFMVPDRAGAPPVRTAKVPELLDRYYPARPLVPIIDVVHHRLAVEIMRGCTRGCRFCSAGMYYRPVREREVDALGREIERGIAASGWRDVGLLSLSSADYCGFPALLAAAESIGRRCRASFSLPSTRIDALSAELLDRMASLCPISSLTIAPEAGSERLRRVINKEFSDQAVFAAVRTLLGRGVQTIKLYFMTGLPGENDDDRTAIISLVERIAGMARAASHRRRVHVSLSPFSPKPHTPFQWEAMEPPGSLDCMNRAIKKGLSGLVNVKVSYRDAAMTLLETVIARGDRAIGTVIHNAWKKGARFDGWDDRFDYGRWDEAAREISVDFARYTGEFPESQELPWSVIDIGVSNEFLLKERERSRTGVVTADCRNGVCVTCGVCDAELKRRIAVTAAPPAALSAATPAGGVAGSPPPVRKVCSYRIIFSKGKAVKFLGHLDMAAVFHRALTAAGLDLVFSQGFEPRPKVSFGPPLPFGVCGDAEGFDIVVQSPFAGDPLRVNAFLPPDLHVLTMKPLAAAGPSLSASIIAGKYRFTPDFRLDGSEARKAVDGALKAQALPVTVSKNGATLTKDIRPLIRELRIEEGKGPVLEAELSLAPGATCKPSELLLMLFPGRNFFDFTTARIACMVLKNGRLVGIQEEGAP